MATSPTAIHGKPKRWWSRLASPILPWHLGAVQEELMVRTSRLSCRAGPAVRQKHGVGVGQVFSLHVRNSAQLACGVRIVAWSHLSAHPRNRCWLHAAALCVRARFRQSDLRDGSLIPADRIRVMFVPQAPPIDPKVHPKDGAALVDVKTGAFASAMTYSANDGIIAGEHKVVIHCFSGGQRRMDLVAGEYGDPKRTPLTVNTSQSPFDLKVRKPAAEPDSQ